MGKRAGHVYGPVMSWRLGLSLGVDLVPFKTCTCDCIYCQLGPTTCLTLERGTYVAVDAVLSDLVNVLRDSPKPDYITLAGSGEPTLHKGIDDIIHGIRSVTRIPVAILTNGFLLGSREVQRECGLADVVLPSLDAGDDATFQRVNRPHPGISFSSLLGGLEEFRKGFGGQIWLEVMLLHGFNDDEAAVRRIAHYSASLNPDRIHLNTAVRPAQDTSVRAVSLAALRRFADYFRPKALTAPCPITGSGEHELPFKAAFEMLLRRPCTLEEIACLMNVTTMEVSKITAEMVREGRLRILRRGGENYYTAISDKSPGKESRGCVNVKTGW